MGRYILEVGAALRYLGVELQFQAEQVQDLGQPGLAVEVPGVEVEADGATEHDAVLGDDGQPGPELLQPHPGRLHSGQPHRAMAGLDDPEEEAGQAGLARPRPPTHPQLFTRAETEVEVVEAGRQVVSVSGLHLLQHQLSELFCLLITYSTISGRV